MMPTIACYRYAIGMRSHLKKGVLSPAIGMRSVCDRVCVQPPIPPKALERALEGRAALDQGSKKGMPNGKRTIIGARHG
jgi:hypothetical protein